MVFVLNKTCIGIEEENKNTFQLLAKTTVPIIQPGSEMNTPNTMRKVREEFVKWVEGEKIEKVEPDIVRIKNEIVDVDARIDALVFGLYGLDEDEVRTVLDSQKVEGDYSERVFGYFKYD